MPTSSTYGWPVIVKSDDFKPTNMSALQGAAFDNRVALERARYEIDVAAPGNLPNTGTYRGQAAWVRNRNTPYYWNGSRWQQALGFATGTLLLNNVSYPGRANPVRWTAPIRVSLPSGRFTSWPTVFVNARVADHATWGQTTDTPTTTSFTMRVFCMNRAPKQVRVMWVAFDQG